MSAHDMRLRLIHTEPTSDSRTGEAYYFVRDVVSRADSFKVVELPIRTGEHEQHYFVQTWMNGWTTVISDVTADSPTAAATRALEVLALIQPQGGTK